MALAAQNWTVPSCKSGDWWMGLSSKPRSPKVELIKVERSSAQLFMLSTGWLGQGQETNLLRKTKTIQSKTQRILHLSSYHFKVPYNLSFWCHIVLRQNICHIECSFLALSPAQTPAISNQGGGRCWTWACWIWLQHRGGSLGNRQSPLTHILANSFNLLEIFWNAIFCALKGFVENDKIDENALNWRQFEC